MPASDTLQIPVWHTTDTDPDAVDDAVAALTEELSPQLNWEITAERKGTVDLPGAPYETYQGYLDGFLEAASLETGTVNVCLYDYSIVDAGLDLIDDVDAILGGAELTSCAFAPDSDRDPSDDAPLAGFDHRPLAVDTKACALVNAGMRVLPFDNLFENFVIHEVLHAMFDDSEAPASGNDHSFGTVINGAASPMLTGYAEPYFFNPTPETACDVDEVPEATGHTTDLSQCTRDEVNRYLTEDFAGGTGGE